MLFTLFQIDEIKEMARQLAALPKKQFDMYRSKTRMSMSGDHFNPQLMSALTVKEKFNSDQMNSVNSEYIAELEVNETVATKSIKKKAKKKKKKKTFVVTEGSSNGDTVKCINSAGTPHSLEMKNKLLDPDQTSSRIVTMNRSMVADICVEPVSPGQSTVPNTISNENVITETLQQKSPDVVDNGKQSSTLYVLKMHAVIWMYTRNSTSVSLY